MVLLHEEDKRNEVQRPHTHRNLKRHISLVSLLLWRKMVAIRCFVWALGLQLWVSETKFQVLAVFKKFNIRPPVSVFMFLMQYFMLDGLILLRQSDFRRMVFEGGFWRRTKHQSGAIPT